MNILPPFSKNKSFSRWKRKKKKRKKARIPRKVHFLLFFKYMERRHVLSPTYHTKNSTPNPHAKNHPFKFFPPSKTKYPKKIIYKPSLPPSSPLASCGRRTGGGACSGPLAPSLDSSHASTANLATFMPMSELVSMVEMNCSMPDVYHNVPA